MAGNNYLKGRSGEEEAARFLAASGVRILDRNFRCPSGEIDLIAKDGQSIVFVEVRTRGSSTFGPPEGSVTGPKRNRIARAAQWYLKDRGLLGSPARFDVVAIRWRGEKPEINWIVNAFEARR